MSDIVSSPEDYFRRFVPARDDLLRRLEDEAEKEDIPIVGPVVGELLWLLARLGRAANILELGTATGYSAIYLAMGAAPWQGRVVSLECDPDMARRAGENLAAAGVADRVEVVTGDALDTLSTLSPPVDMVFLDIEKEDYIRCLPHCAHLLRPDGLLVADNVGFADAVPFVRKISSDPGWRPVHLFSFLPFHSPENDGLCLALKVG